MTEGSRVLAGLLVPAIAPLDLAGGLDRPSFERHVERVLAAGAHGLWINGTSGDFHALNEDELLATVHSARAVAGDRAVIVAHVGDTATQRVLIKATRAIDAGADYVAAVTPYYTEYTEGELARHYRRIAEASGRGVMLYQHPSTGKEPLSVDLILELAGEGVLAGIKESGSDRAYFERLMRSVAGENSPLRAFHGAGARALETLTLGTAGIITVVANLLPATCANLYEAFRNGRLDEAEAAQARVCALAERLVCALPTRTTSAPVIAAYKHLLKELGVFATDEVAQPLQPLDDEERATLQAEVLPLVRADGAFLENT